MFRRARPCVSLSALVWPCLALSGLVSACACFVARGLVCACLRLSGLVWPCLALSGLVWPCLALFRRARVSSCAALSAILGLPIFYTRKSVVSYVRDFRLGSADFFLWESFRLGSADFFIRGSQ